MHSCSPSSGRWDPLGTCSVLKGKAQNALNSSALSLSPLGGDILIQNRPIHGIPTLPLATNRFEQTSPHGSFPAPLPQACSSGRVAVAKCRSQHFTCGQPDSPSGRGGQGPPQGTDKLCPWHTLAEEKHLPKQLRAVSRAHRSLKCPPRPSSHQFPHAHTARAKAPAQRESGKLLLPTSPRRDCPEHGRCHGPHHPSHHPTAQSIQPQILTPSQQPGGLAGVGDGRNTPQKPLLKSIACGHSRWFNLEILQVAQSLPKNPESCWPSSPPPPCPTPL